MIYLMSMFPESYAQREMQYTARFLNHKCLRRICECLHGADNWKDALDAKPNDCFVIADYKQHPSYWDRKVQHYEMFTEYDKIVAQLNPERIVAWCGDCRFPANFQEARKVIATVPMVFGPISEEEQTAFFSRFCREPYPELVSWKTLLPELPYDYTLSETQVDWLTSITYQRKKYDLTYICNGVMKRRQWLIPYFYGDGKYQLGNWLNSKVKICKDFADGNPQHDYIDRKVFGSAYLSMISASYYSIMANDDDITFPRLLHARFWESIAAGVIPLVHISMDPDRLLYKGYDFCRMLCYFDTPEKLQNILVRKPMYQECLRDITAMKAKFIGV